MKLRITVLVGVIAVAACAGLTSVREAPALAGQDPAQTVADIEAKLAAALADIAAITANAEDEINESISQAEAAGERDEGIADVARRVDEAKVDIQGKYEQNPDDPAVIVAYEAALADLDSAQAQAEAEIGAAYDAWMAANGSSSTTTTIPPTTTTVPPTTTTIPPTTTTMPPTTTTIPPTTTTAPPTTTTTTVASTTTTTTVTTSTTSTTVTVTPTTVPPSTTTTTLAPAAQLPPLEPPGSESAFMIDLPATVVFTSTQAAADPVTGMEGDMATVGFVRRAVDSQLPAGVSAVAAGPLVVLGLIIDAVRAAGTLMLVPWLVLGAYVLILLRSQQLHGWT